MGSELKVEGMTDNLHLEWSTNLYHALSQLLGAFRKTKPLSPGSQNFLTESDLLRQEETTLQSSVKKSLVHLLKFDMSNINLFVSNAVGGSTLLFVTFSSFFLWLMLKMVYILYIYCM